MYITPLLNILTVIDVSRENVSRETFIYMEVCDMAKDINRFYQLVIQACQDANIGYSQANRRSISLAAVSAVCGNFWRESHVNPSLWEGLVVGGPGFGLGQWTGDRRTALFEWMDSHGYDRADGDGQIEFLIEEGDWIDVSGSPLHFDSLMDFLTTDDTDVAKLTETYMRCWERPGVPALNERVEFAKKCYTWLQGHGSDSVEWITGNRYLSEAEGLNNSIRVWQKLSLIIGGGTGGEGWSNLMRFGVARELYRRRYIWR